MTAIALVWNLYLAGVLFSPLYFPVTSETFNYSPVIFGGITIFGVLTWYFTPESDWLPAGRLGKVHDLVESDYNGAPPTYETPGMRSAKDDTTL